jgi:hypothetical protein
MQRRFSAFTPFLIVASLLASASTPATVPAGLQVQVRFIDHLSSENAKVGQVFHATLQSPLPLNSRTVYPKGSRITGKVTAVHPSGRLSDPGVLQLVLTSVSNGRSSSTLTTQAFLIKGESHAKANIEKIGGTTAAGAIMGAIFGGGKGAAVGAGVGAATGTGIAAATGRKDAKVESEAVLAFVTIASTADTTVARSGQETQGQRTYRDESADEDSLPRYDRPDRAPEDRSYQNDQRDNDRTYGADRVFMLRFSDGDRQVIRSCYDDDYANLPPGLAKKNRLPPGLERQLERNGTLPPGLQKRVQPLPGSCERQLPPVQSGWSRVVVSGRVLLLNRENRIIDLFFLRE